MRRKIGEVASPMFTLSDEATTLLKDALVSGQSLICPFWYNLTLTLCCSYLGGYIAALFFAVGAPSAMLVGYLCDRMNRRNLLFIVVVLGAACTPSISPLTY